MEIKRKIFELIKSIVIQSETEIAIDHFQKNETNIYDYNHHLGVIHSIGLSKNWDEFIEIMDKNYSMGIEDIISTYCSDLGKEQK
jgi:hypothetical protein